MIILGEQLTGLICTNCKSGPYTPETCYCLSCGEALPGGGLLHDKYHLVRTLGQGGLGHVYLAEDIKVFNRLCAIKRIGPPQTQIDLEYARREARMLAQLHNAGVPGVPDIYDAFDFNNSFFLVMKFIEGQNLQEWCEQNRPGWRLVVERFIAVLKTLSNLHSLPTPIVHADIKPVNILQDDFNQTWLTDFGLARAINAGGSKTTSYVPAGSWNFSAWEQWSQRPTPAADMYAIGLSLYFVLAGESIFEQRKTAAANFAMPHAGLLEEDYFSPNWPAQLKKAMLLATQETPEERITAREFQNLLEACLPRAGRAPLTLPNGEKLYQPLDLVDLAERNWEGALQLLADGTFVGWVRNELLQDGLANSIENFLKQNTDANEALEAALRLVAPNLPGPRLEFKPAEVDLGRIGLKPKNVSLRLRNAGRGYLRLQIKSPVPWVEVQPDQIVLSGPAVQKVNINVLPHRLPPWKGTASTEITFTGKNQTSNVTVWGDVLFLDMVWHRVIRPFFHLFRKITGPLSAFLVGLAFTSVTAFPVLASLHPENSPIPGFLAALALPLLAKLGTMVGVSIGVGAIQMQPFKQVLKSLGTLYLSSLAISFLAFLSALVASLIPGTDSAFGGAIILCMLLISTFATLSVSRNLFLPDNPYEHPLRVVLGPILTFVLLILFISIFSQISTFLLANV